jgi:hypothetical protein
MKTLKITQQLELLGLQKMAHSKQNTFIHIIQI